MSKELANSAEKIRGMAGDLLKLSLQVDVPPLDTSRVANEGELISRIDSWTKATVRTLHIAKAITRAMDSFAKVESLIDKENEKLALFAEAESLLKKRKEEEKGDTLAHKAYSAARVVEAVKHGFKVTQ